MHVCREFLRLLFIRELSRDTRLKSSLSPRGISNHIILPSIGNDHVAYVDHRFTILVGDDWR